MSASKMVRRVMRAFEVRQVTEDNAIELALWLRDAGRELGVPEGLQPLVSFAREKPVLVPTTHFGGDVPALAGSWMGGGWPNLIHDGDIGTPRLLVLADSAIEDQTDDQGVEVVRR